MDDTPTTVDALRQEIERSDDTTHRQLVEHDAPVRAPGLVFYAPPIGPMTVQFAAAG